MALRVLNNPLDPDYAPSDPSPVTGSYIDPNAPTATPPPPTPPTGGSQDPQALWQQYQTENPGFHPTQANPTSLQPFIDWAKGKGVDLSMAAPGSGGYVKGIMFNGQFVKLLDGSDRPIWQVGGDVAGGGGPAATGLDPSYLTPYSTSFSDYYPDTLGAGDPSGSLNPPAFQSPGAFHAPTPDSILSDPSYQFRVDQGKGAIENSAAARGTLNSGGTLSDILNYGQKAASQEYGNIYNRDLGLWDANWNHALADYGTKAGANDTAYNRAWTQYMNNRDTFYKNQQSPFDKLYAMSSLGASTAAAG